MIRLQLPDAAVADHEDELTSAITSLAGPLLLSTWRHDGHPDHEATGRAAAAAAARLSIPLLEYTVWAEHRGRLLDRPGDPPPAVATSRTRAAKCRAIDAYTSQLEPSPDGRPVVPAELVHRLRTDDEVLLAGRRAA